MRELEIHSGPFGSSRTVFRTLTIFLYLILWDGNCFLVFIVLNIGGGDSFAARFGASNDVCSPAHSA